MNIFFNKILFGQNGNWCTGRVPLNPDLLHICIKVNAASPLPPFEHSPLKDLFYTSE